MRRASLLFCVLAVACAPRVVGVLPPPGDASVDSAAPDDVLPLDAGDATTPPDATPGDGSAPDAMRDDATADDVRIDDVTSVDAMEPDAMTTDGGRTCTPGTVDCADGRDRRLCNPDGRGYTTLACPMPANATPTCAMGACGITCTPGWGDCDRNTLNGCEVNGFTDANHCGGCGNRCESGTCVGGVCSRLIRGLGGATGFGAQCVASNDDGAWPGVMGMPAMAIALAPAFPGGVRFFGMTYTSFFLNTNGNISFGAAYAEATPPSYPGTTAPTIAAWLADVDTRSGGQPGRNNICFAVSPQRAVITWDRVGYFNMHDAPQNTFQLVLTRPATAAGDGDFDVEFRYETCGWTSGDSMGAMGGLGGSAARVGFDAGDRMRGFELPLSMARTPLMLCARSNVGVPGVWRYAVRNGVVAP